MRGLLALVIGMGVLIVVGVGGLVGTVAMRLGRDSAPLRGGVSVLDEPAGTVVQGTAIAGDRLAVSLRGGGVDRVVVLDLRDGRVVRRVQLAR